MVLWQIIPFALVMRRSMRWCPTIQHYAIALISSQHTIPRHGAAMSENLNIAVRIIGAR